MFDASDLTLPKGWMDDGPGDVAPKTESLKRILLDGWSWGVRQSLERAKRCGMVAYGSPRTLVRDVEVSWRHFREPRLLCLRVMGGMSALSSM